MHAIIAIWRFMARPMGKVIRFKKSSLVGRLHGPALPRLRMPAIVLPIIFVIAGLFGIVAMEYGLPPILSSKDPETIRVLRGSGGSSIAIPNGYSATARQPAMAELSCIAPRIIDGDTFDCGGVRVRLTSIDAPELPGHCQEGRQCVEGDPYAARAYLVGLTRDRVACNVLNYDHYGRAIGSCNVDNTDLSCAMVNSGHAVERYGRLSC